MLVARLGRSDGGDIARALFLQLRRVQARDQISGLNPSTLADGQFGQAARYLEGEIDLGEFEKARLGTSRLLSDF